MVGLLITAALLLSATQDDATRASVTPAGKATPVSGTGVASFLTMGEAMLRFAPIDGEAPVNPDRHEPHPFLRSIGGDELNVAVALQLMGVHSRWVSVLPSGPLGDVITSSCLHHGVEFAGPRVAGADIGTFYVLPEERTVHYQRRHSAFALHDPSSLDWANLLHATAERPWLHVTGITPLISDSARRSWDAALAHASSIGMPVSCDLNHRKQLGTLAQLWAIARPHVALFELLILSVDQLNGLAALELGDAAPPPLTGASEDEAYFHVMSTLQLRWRCRRLVLCRKVRDESSGVQRRWSVLTYLTSGGVGEVERYSSYKFPVYHTVREELGGGSAFAAGMLLALHFKTLPDMRQALRRADLLAALCQQSAGDFSTVTAWELHAAEEKFRDRFAVLPPPTAAVPPHPITSMPARVGGLEPSLNATLESTLVDLKDARLLGILRSSGDPGLAIARGLELASLGCRAIEVTLDSVDWPKILSALREQLPLGVRLGVGTVMDETVSYLGIAASLGATFALSPIDPLGFVDECHRLGVLPVPSAFTSNEWWALHRRGVKLIKLFHAGQSSPSILKSMLGVGPLGSLNIMPSGGVSPANADAWLRAGAAVIGMGSNLVGRLSTTPGTAEHEEALRVWARTEQPIAKELFARLVVARRE